MTCFCSHLPSIAICILWGINDFENYLMWETLNSYWHWEFVLKINHTVYFLFFIFICFYQHTWLVVSYMWIDSKVKWLQSELQLICNVMSSTWRDQPARSFIFLHSGTRESHLKTAPSEMCVTLVSTNTERHVVV